MMFGLFKSISLVIVGILITGCTFVSNISNNDTMSNDDLVNSYDNFLQDISLNGLTKDNKLEGKRKYGIDEYVGTYKANYNSKTKEETIFGGTTLDRKNGNNVKLKIKVEKQSGNIEIISNEGTESKVLINDTGEIEKTVDVKEKSYYLKVKVTNFTGNVKIVAE